MKTVYLLRHAKAKKGIPGLPDFQRPLENRGKDDASRMGRWMKHEGVCFDRVFCSPANRAKETITFLLPALHAPLPRIEYVDSLYPGSPEEIIELLMSLKKESTVLVCGHNPSIEELADQWAGKPLEKFRTCGCFRASFSLDDWKDVAQRSPDAWDYVDPRSLE